jgi:hypothetical protein
MRRTHRIALIAAAAAMSAVASLTIARPAMADPMGQQGYVEAGSCTTQDVMDALAGQPIVPAGTIGPPSGTLTKAPGPEWCGTGHPLHAGARCRARRRRLKTALWAAKAGTGRRRAS